MDTIFDGNVNLEDLLKCTYYIFVEKHFDILKSKGEASLIFMAVEPHKTQ